MISTNKVLGKLNKIKAVAPLKALIYLGYKLRGVKVEWVQYHESYNAWEFRIGSVSYLSTAPGWAYNHSFLLNQLKQLSCNHYLPKTGDIVFDIGAGVGEETVVLSELVGATGKVYACEAHPKTFGALSYMVNKNELTNVVCVPVAFSNKSGIVEIDDTENSLANTILPTGNPKAFQVKGQTLDQFVDENKIERIDLVKMNVEGAEQLIIQGMNRSLPIIRHVAISCHDFLYNSGQSEYFKTKDIVISFLREKGFLVSTHPTSAYMIEDYVYATNPACVEKSNETR
jgi:FkbM family methyltransferase